MYNIGNNIGRYSYILVFGVCFERYCRFSIFSFHEKSRFPTAIVQRVLKSKQHGDGTLFAVGAF